MLHILAILVREITHACICILKYLTNPVREITHACNCVLKYMPNTDAHPNCFLKKDYIWLLAKISFTKFSGKGKKTSALYLSYIKE